MQITSETVYRLFKQLEAKVKEENHSYEVYTNVMTDEYRIDELIAHLNRVRFEIARITEKLLPIMRAATTHYEEENSVLLRGSDNAK